MDVCLRECRSGRQPAGEGLRFEATLCLLGSRPALTISLDALHRESMEKFLEIAQHGNYAGRGSYNNGPDGIRYSATVKTYARQSPRAEPEPGQTGCIVFLLPSVDFIASSRMSKRVKDRTRPLGDPASRNGRHDCSGFRSSARSALVYPGNTCSKRDDVNTQLPSWTATLLIAHLVASSDTRLASAYMRRIKARS